MNIAATLRTEKSQPNLPTEKAPTGSAHRGDPIQARKQTRVAGALRATLTLADPNLNGEHAFMVLIYQSSRPWALVLI